MSRPYLQVSSDEAAESSLANVGVDARGVGRSAALTPGDGSEKDLGALVDNGAARVTLARVLATRSQTGAEHLGGDGGGAVRSLARAARDDGDVDLEEVGGEGRTARRSGAPREMVSYAFAEESGKTLPAGNGKGGSGSGVGARGRQRGVSDGRTRWDGSSKLHDGEVTVVGARSVARVDLDG